MTRKAQGTIRAATVDAESEVRTREEARPALPGSAPGLIEPAPGAAPGPPGRSTPPTATEPSGRTERRVEVPGLRSDGPSLREHALPRRSTPNPPVARSSGRAEGARDFRGRGRRGPQGVRGLRRGLGSRGGCGRRRQGEGRHGRPCEDPRHVVRAREEAGSGRVARWPRGRCLRLRRRRRWARRTREVAEAPVTRGRTAVPLDARVEAGQGSPQTEKGVVPGLPVPEAGQGAPQAEKGCRSRGSPRLRPPRGRQPGSRASGPREGSGAWPRAPHRIREVPYVPRCGTGRLGSGQGAFRLLAPQAGDGGRSGKGAAAGPQMAGPQMPGLADGRAADAWAADGGTADARAADAGPQMAGPQMVGPQPAAALPMVPMAPMAWPDAGRTDAGAARNAGRAGNDAQHAGRLQPADAAGAPSPASIMSPAPGASADSQLQGAPLPRDVDGPNTDITPVAQSSSLLSGVRGLPAVGIAMVGAAGPALAADEGPASPWSATRFVKGALLLLLPN